MQAQMTQPGKRVFLTEEKVKATGVEEAARRAGGRIATLMEVVMDRQVVEQIKGTIKGTSTFADWKGVPEKEGFYRINRERGQLEPASREELLKFEWHERLGIFKDVFDAVKRKLPLVAYVGYEDGGRLVVYVDSDIKYGGRALVAYVKDTAPIAQEHDVNFPIQRTDPKRWEALKRDLGIAPSEGISLPDNLPHPASETDFTANGIKYRILRYEKGKGPNFKQTIDIAGRVGLLMLTREESQAIIDNGESNKTFKKTLNEGEWAYIRNSESESQSRAAYLGRGRNGWLGVGGYYRPDDAASVVILKEAID